MHGDCIFCTILQEHIEGKKTESGEDKVLYEDDQCAIFADIAQNATAHYLCVPKRHIKNFTRLILERTVDGEGNTVHDSDDLGLLLHMETKGKQFLQERHSEKNMETEIRMGFHGPRFNS